jgi:hypothetical protein
MRYQRLFLLLLSVFLPAADVFGWGAVELMCPTHQLIDRQAYLRLQQDPAMPGSNFLALDQIMAHEGVVGEMSATLDFGGHGPGPDSAGASPYSYHYYNPLTDRGGAPGAASQFYFDLLNPAGRDRAKGAAWAAHFIADMSVPYHIVGMPRDDAFEYAGANRNLIDVRETGPLILYDNSREGALIPPEGWGGFGNFADALRLYVTKLSENEADWFDPWYANGTGYHNSQKVAFSSHVLWENGAYHGYRGWSANAGYNPEWRNAAPNYGFVEMQVEVSQAARAGQFAIDAALFTSRSIEALFRDPSLGIDEAIRNVATLWRASFSGLRPTLKAYPDPRKSNLYAIEGRVQNSAIEDAINPAVKITVRNGEQVWSSPGRYAGRLAPNGEVPFSFRITTEPDTTYDISLEVVAEYQMPDLQYAVATTSIRTLPGTRTTADLPQPDFLQPPQPGPSSGQTRESPVLRGFLDQFTRQEVLRKKTNSSYYDAYDADAMTLKVDANGVPEELLGTINRTIVSTVNGKDYSVTYTYQTRYMPIATGPKKPLRVDRLTRKTTRMTTVSKSGAQHVKTSVATSHDANCPVTRVVDNSRPDDYLVILPHGSGNAPDVPWLLERVSP